MTKHWINDAFEALGKGAIGPLSYIEIQQLVEVSKAALDVVEWEALENEMKISGAGAIWREGRAEGFRLLIKALRK